MPRAAMRLVLDGACVLLTGASSGIGREMARLIATRWRAIEALKAELAAINPKLVVHLLPCDLSDLAATERLARDAPAVLGRVDVLINNAGVGDFAIFDRADWPRLANLMTLNVNSLVLLTHRLVPPMVARGQGGVLNMSSGYGLGFTPGFAVYTGSKHFVTGFTEALALDLSGTGVVVSQVCPGPVSTEFNAGSGEGVEEMVPAFASMSASRCARVALRGFERGRALIVPGWVMKVMAAVIALTPRFIMRLSMRWVARRFRRKPAGGSAPG